LEEIIISGNEETVKPIITMLMGISQMLNNRDIGQFVGQPLEENVRAIPSLLSLRIVWHSIKLFPFTRKPEKRLIQVECNIPDIRRTNIKWDLIKQLAGGSDGYEWGKYLANARLSNGRQIQVRGATEEIAKKQIENMLTLTKAEVTSLAISELKKEGRRASGQSMEIIPTRIYPAYFVIFNTKKINDTQRRIYQEEKNTKRYSTLKGDYIRQGTERIPLYNDKAPKNYKKIIANALKTKID
jgi:hypothetical protein